MRCTPRAPMKGRRWKWRFAAGRRDAQEPPTMALEAAAVSAGRPQGPTDRRLGELERFGGPGEGRLEAEAALLATKADVREELDRLARI